MPLPGCLLRAYRRSATQLSSRGALGPPRWSSTSSFPSPSSSQAPTIFSGIQPTGVPHLGNYLGALRQWVKLQNEAPPTATLLYSVVDLHAITISQDPSNLRRWRKEMLASLLAVGLDPQRSIIFSQSAVPAHSELMWILSCNASVGYLSRMTQWKSKLSLPENATALNPSTKTELKLGLFSYPVLQAADILVHRATHVPVGADQSQHLEFTREIANGFNHIYGAILPPPETILSPARRVMSLRRPTQKMSKSDPDPKSRVLISDSYDDIKKKIRAAVTDSNYVVGGYDPAGRPGMSNLIEIMHHMDEGGAESCEALGNNLKDLTIPALKERVTDTIDRHLREVREKYQYFLYQEPRLLADISEEGARKARQSADATLHLVKEAIGIS